MPRTEFNLSTPGFVCDNNSMRKNSGRQIDWDGVDDSRVDETSGKKVIPAGTAVSVSTNDATKIVPSADTDATGNAIGLLVSNAVEDDPSAALSGYGVYIGGVVFEDLTPDGADGSNAFKAELATSGCTFQWERYSDSSVS